MATYGGKPAPEPDLWERRYRQGEPTYSESDQAYEAFDVYKNMGLQRSLAKTARQLGKSDQLMEQWSRKHEWRRRVVAWDIHAAKEKNRLLLAGTAEMRERHATQALNIMARSAQRILTMTPSDIDNLSPVQAAVLFKIASDIERKARNIPDDQGDVLPFQVIVNTTVGVSGSTQKELMDVVLRPGLPEPDMDNVIP